jgi:hypothetical protein
VIDKATRSSLAAQKDQILGTEISKIMHLDIEKLLQFAIKKSYVINYSISVLSNAFILIFLMGGRVWSGSYFSSSTSPYLPLFSIAGRTMRHNCQTDETCECEKVYKFLR